MEHSSTIASPMVAMDTTDTDITATITTMFYIGIMAMGVIIQKNLTGGLMFRLEPTLNESTLLLSVLRFVDWLDLLRNMTCCNMIVVDYCCLCDYNSCDKSLD